MGAVEVGRFLTDLAVRGRVAASTQNQALNALVFLYREVLRQELGKLGEFLRAKRAVRLPVVLAVEEVRKMLSALTGTCQLRGQMLYGTGMRLMEVIRLRVKDVAFGQNQIIVRGGKEAKDRVTVLPESLKEGLRQHWERVRLLHEQDVAAGGGDVYLPYALERTCPLGGFFLSPRGTHKGSVPLFFTLGSVKK